MPDFINFSMSLIAFDGYIAEFHFVDGEQKDADDFGKTDDNGVRDGGGRVTLKMFECLKPIISA